MIAVVPSDWTTRWVGAVRDQIVAVHLDISDDLEVDDRSPAAETIASLRANGLAVECALSVDHPDRLIASTAAAGAVAAIVPVTTDQLFRTSRRAREQHLRFGVSMALCDPLSSVRLIIDAVDIVVVQATPRGVFDPGSVTRVANLRDEIDERRLDVELQVVGGIDELSAPRLIDAGADSLIVAVNGTTSVRGMRAACVGAS